MTLQRCCTLLLAILLTACTAQAVTFQWDAVTTATSYTILKDVNCRGNWTVHAHSLPNTVQMYTDTQTEGAMLSCYTVVAVDSRGQRGQMKDMIRFSCQSMRQGLLCMYTTLRGVLQ
jgi:hypothetical protein